MSTTEPFRATIGNVYAEPTKIRRLPMLKIHWIADGGHNRRHVEDAFVFAGDRRQDKWTMRRLESLCDALEIDLGGVFVPVQRIEGSAAFDAIVAALKGRTAIISLNGDGRVHNYKRAEREPDGGENTPPKPTDCHAASGFLNQVAQAAHAKAQEFGEKAAVLFAESGALMPNEVLWTRYDGGKKSTRGGKTCSGPWRALGDELVSYSRRTVPKGAGRWIMGATSRNGRCRDADIDAIHVVTLDADGTGDWDRVRAVLDEARLAHIVQRSSSHSATTPRWHLSLALATPWGGQKPHWRLIWRWLAGFFAGVAGLRTDLDGKPYGFDHSTDRLGQPIFPAAKRCSTDSPPETVVRDGLALDIEEFLARSGFDHGLFEETARWKPEDADTIDPDNALLALVFAEAGMLGPRIDRGDTHGFAVECPFEHQHTSGDRFDTSTILFDPGPGQDKGHLHCSHRCGDIAANDVLKLLPEDAVERATTRWKQATSAADAHRTTTDDGRTIIRLSPDVHVTVDQAIVALRADGDLYQRAGRLVHVVPVTHEEAKDGCGIIPGAPTIRDLPREVLETRLSKFAAFLKLTKEGWHRVSPPEDIAAKVHAMGRWDGIRPLLGVVESPILLRDGTVLQTPGYHAGSGLLYVPSGTFDIVPDAPTRDDAKAAYERLAYVFVNFPFVSPAARLVPVAAISTIQWRNAIDGYTPGFLTDSPTPGTGKSLEQDAISLIVAGRECPRANYPVDRGETNQRELSSVLGSFALAGVQYLLLDNIPPTVPFGGGVLDLYMTARQVDLRILGKHKNARTSWSAVVLATANNPQFSDDGAVRRWLSGRLDANVAEPDKRPPGTFKEHLSTYIPAERHRLAVATLIIARAYIVAGRPKQPVADWGGYEPWTRLVASALYWVTGVDVGGARIAREASPKRTAFATFILLLAELFGADETHAMYTRDLVDAAYRGRRAKDASKGVQYATFCDALEQLSPPPAGSATTDPGRLGNTLRRYKGQVLPVETGALKLTTTQPDRNGVVRWFVEKVSH